MSGRSPRLWAIRTAIRAVGAVAPGVAAHWAETLFCTRLETTTGLGHRALLRDPSVIARTVAFLAEDRPE